MNLSQIKHDIRRMQANLKWMYQLSKRVQFHEDKAYEILNAFYPKEKPAFTQTNIINPEVDLHIIVPVYNVEAYLKDCIESLVTQHTQYTYHITLVNDGATDCSAAILSQYAGRNNITVIHKENGGLSSARNAALRTICGKYVMFVDSDDLLTEYAVQTLLDIAFEKNADIVEGSHQVFNSKGTGQCCIHENEIMKYDSKVLYGFAWGKVIKNHLLADFCFPEGYLFEDTVMSTLLHPVCERIYTTPEIVYLYRENEAGISKTSGASPRCIDTFWMMKYCLEERIRRNQVMDTSDLDKYLYALYRNWGRTCKMPRDVQESIFVLSCELIGHYFGTLMEGYRGAYIKMLKTVQYESFSAFETLVNNWWLM